MKGEHLGDLEELILLALMAVEGDTTTVEIQRILEEEAARSLTLGAIYAALDRLTDKRFVESNLAEPRPVRGGRRKRLYQITGSGKKALIVKENARNALRQRANRLSFTEGGIS